MTGSLVVNGEPNTTVNVSHSECSVQGMQRQNSIQITDDCCACCHMLRKRGGKIVSMC